jgi:Diacylglycerol acyltransferase
MIYFIAPFYMISAVLVLLRFSQSSLWAWIYVAPILISALLPSMAMPSVLRQLTPVLDYFDFEEIFEATPINVAQEIISGRKNYLLVLQPHGALSFVSIASAIHGTFPELQGRLGTAVADAVLYTPIIKHVLGIFGLVSASKKSMQRTMRKKGIAGSMVLYVGGMAELFLSCDKDERLYLKNRKGFIKLALASISRKVSTVVCLHCIAAVVELVLSAAYG